jgi:hypothetical protein
MSERPVTPDFDPRVADWLEDDPDRAPDHVLETILAAVPSIPQRRASRVPWRFVTMNRFAQLGAAAAIAIVLVGGAVLVLRPGGNVGGTTPSSSPASSGSAVPSSRSSAAAATSLPSPITAQTACDLLTTTEAAAQAPGFGAIAVLSGEGADTSCRFANGGGDGIVTVSLTSPGGRAAFTAAAAKAGVETIDGLGGDAIFDPATATLSIARDDALATIVSGSSADPAVTRRSVATQFARLIVPRLPGTSAAASSGSAEPLPTLAQTYTSARHGFSLKVPTSWTVTPATAAWPVGTEGPTPPSPKLDVFKDPADPTITLAVLSQPIGSGVTTAKWLSTYERSSPAMPTACWPPAAQMETATVDGQTAWIHGGIAACGFTEAVVFGGGRVYEITAYFPPGDTPISRPLFDALIASVKLDPGAADDSR